MGEWRLTGADRYPIGEGEIAKAGRDCGFSQHISAYCGDAGRGDGRGKDGQSSLTLRRCPPKMDVMGIRGNRP